MRLINCVQYIITCVMNSKELPKKHHDRNGSSAVPLFTRRPEGHNSIYTVTLPIRRGSFPQDVVVVVNLGRQR